MTLNIYSMKNFKILLTLSIAYLVVGCQTKVADITPEQAKQIAKEAYVFAYPMLENYKILYSQSVDKQSPAYEGPVNTLTIKRELLDYTYRAVVAPNNNTLYSYAWINLTTEPLVFTVPQIPEDRYFVFQFVDMYTHNYNYICHRVTGNDVGGKYLLVGPNWDGEIPEGFKDVFKSEGNFVFLLGRIYIAGKEDLDSVHSLQDQIKLVTFSDYQGKEALPAAKIDWPVYDDKKAKSAEFITYFNFLLKNLKVDSTEKELLAKFSKIGIGADKEFNLDKLDPAIAKAIEEGVQEAYVEIDKHRADIGRQVNGWNNFGSGFGSRVVMQGRYLDRASAAMAGIYGNDPEENNTYSLFQDADGNPLDGSKYNYVLEFPAGQVPPVKGFWSITMYDDKFLMIENPLNRYSVYGEDKLLKYGEGNSLKLYFQHDSPGKEKEGNWLPAPNGKFVLAIRIYWPESEVLDGTWSPPALKKVEK